MKIQSIMLPGLVLIPLLAPIAGAQDADVHDDSGHDEQAQADQADLESLRAELLGFQDALLRLEAAAKASAPGLHRFVMSGFSAMTFTDAERKASSFKAFINPILLYQIGDRFLFEAELEFSLEPGSGGSAGGETDTELGYAAGSYILNDYATIGVGKFLTPFGIFMERIHPSWINKLPMGPLTAGHGGLIPAASVGAFVRGGFEVGEDKMNYAIYLSNGPRLNTGIEEPDEAGRLHFDNYADGNNNKSLGLRVGYLPIPTLELGFSYLTAGVTPLNSNVEDATANLLGVDLSYDVIMDGNRVSIRGEYVWSDVEDVTYDADGSGGFGPLQYTNERDGGYLQLANRFGSPDGGPLSPWEAVVRRDILNNPTGAPETFDQQRWVVGLNYWVAPTNVIKVAYAFDDKDGLNALDQDMFLIQFAMGF
jgi:hypothetical protein